MIAVLLANDGSASVAGAPPLVPLTDKLKSRRPDAAFNPSTAIKYVWPGTGVNFTMLRLVTPPELLSLAIVVSAETLLPVYTPSSMLNGVPAVVKVTSREDEAVQRHQIDLPPGLPA